MSHRFYIESIPNSDTPLTLEGDQAHHAINVMRFKEGDTVVLFDGQGREFTCKIDGLGKKKLQLTIVEAREDQAVSRRKLTLAVALPKGDRQKFMIEKLVELGVYRFIPLDTTRSVAAANSKVLERMQKQVIEACKQCGRNTLMKVEAASSVPDLIIRSSEFTTAFVADPYAETAIPDVEFNDESNVLVAVGPEGGFDKAEMKVFSDGQFQGLRVGDSILRIETAAIALAAIVVAG